MPRFTNAPEKATPLPQAKPLAPTVKLTDTILQRDRVDPQRSFTSSYGDTRRDFPPPGGSVATYPSTATTVEPMTQPTNPMVGPIKPRRMK